MPELISRLAWASGLAILAACQAQGTFISGDDTAGGSDTASPDSGPSPQPDIDVDPSSLDWGAQLPGCSSNPKAVTVRNGGGAPLHIDDMEIVGDGASAYTLAGDTSATLSSGEALEVEVSFLPEHRIDYPADLEIQSDDPDEDPAWVGLSGEGAQRATHEDVFDQDAPSSLDLLWVLDLSCSMSDVISEVETGFGDFVGTLATLGLDYQIGVTTADMDDGPQGRLLGPGGDTGSPLIMRSATMTSAEIVQAFDDAVGTGADQSATEKVLGAAYASLEDPGHAVDAGLVRDDATLAVIVVGDEDDQSGRSASDYVSWMDTYKVDPEETSISGIIPTPDGGGNIWEVDNCGLGLSKIPQTIDGTRGSEQNLCALSESFATSMRQLAFTAAGLDHTFFLSRVPASGSAGIDVTVAGHDVQEDPLGSGDGWHYLSGDNAVQFLGDALPGPGAQVVISYPIEGTCQD